MKLLLAAALLMSTATGLTFEPGYSLDERDPALDPQAYVQLEILRLGVGCHGWSEPGRFLGLRTEGRLFHLGVEVHRFRAGIALLDGTTADHKLSFLPVTLGYTLYEQPTTIAGRLYGKRPELYVEATARWQFANFGYPPYPRYAGILEMVGSADYIAGASAAVGLKYVRFVGYPIGSPDYSVLRPFIGVRVQLPVLRVGF